MEEGDDLIYGLTLDIELCTKVVEGHLSVCVCACVCVCVSCPWRKGTCGMPGVLQTVAALRDRCGPAKGQVQARNRMHSTGNRLTQPPPLWP
jgi:hypothetical protein